MNPEAFMIATVGIVALVVAIGIGCAAMAAVSWFWDRVFGETMRAVNATFATLCAVVLLFVWVAMYVDAANGDDEPPTCEASP